MYAENIDAKNSLRLLLLLFTVLRAAERTRMTAPGRAAGEVIDIIVIITVTWHIELGKGTPL